MPRKARKRFTTAQVVHLLKTRQTQAADVLRLLELLRECERVLALVPAVREPTPGFLAELQRGYVTPLIQKIRDEFA